MKQLQDAIKGIKAIERSPSVVCSDPTLQKEVDAISLVLDQLADSECPASALSGSTSKFFGQVLELSEAFLTSSCVEKAGVFSHKVVGRRGKPAM